MLDDSYFVITRFYLFCLICYLMKKILLLSDSFNGYGAEHMIGWIGNMLADNGYEVIFCSIYDKSKNEKLSSKSNFISLNLDRDTNPLFLIFRYFMFAGIQIGNLCRKYDIDIIITFKENPLCIALIAKLFSKVKHIHSERDDPYNRDTIASKIKMWLYRFADHIVFQTIGAQKYFCKKIIDKSSIIPNPVVIPDLLWIPEKAHKTIANVGRLNVRYKRQDLLIRAFASLKEELSDWKLIFYGDGKDRKYLESLAKEQNVSEQVIFKGRVENVIERLVDDGIFVLTSDTEGLPNVLLEAMSIGMPVVATDCSPGGARTLLSENNGILVERGNVSEIANAIMKMVENTEFSVNVSRNARNSVLQYNPQAIYKKWVCVINSID